ncbi:UNVERIFIED_CONTAM: hypothetical protein FKN15_042118 [Acipenser sinensis]
MNLLVLQVLLISCGLHTKQVLEGFVTQVDKHKDCGKPLTSKSRSQNTKCFAVFNILTIGVDLII